MQLIYVFPKFNNHANIFISGILLLLLLVSFIICVIIVKFDKNKKTRIRVICFFGILSIIITITTIMINFNNTNN